MTDALETHNKTLTSERFSDLSQINTKNVAKLKVLCTYDTWRLTSFEAGLIMGGAGFGGWLYATDADTGVEVEASVQLSDRERRDADRWGPCVLRRHRGNFYAIGAATGQKLWGRKIGGAIAGSVIYTANGAQTVRWRPALYSPSGRFRLRTFRLRS